MQVTAQAPIDVQQVKEYDLFLDVDFESLKFSGRVGINIDSAADVKLDAVDLKVPSAKANTRTVSFKQHGNVVDIQTGRISGLLEFEYSGKVSESLTGPYTPPSGATYVLSPRFGPAHAGRL